MNTRRRVILGIALIAFCGAIYAQGQGGNQVFVNPHQVINKAASSAKTDDEHSISALVDAVFNFPHTWWHMPDAMQAVVKNRLVQAETGYLQGRSPGVQEQGVVDVINMLADRFGVPEYGKTSVKQVRYLRMSLALGEPAFMGRGVARPGAKIGEQVNPEMSPLQAAHVMQLLIDQKFSDPDYQVSPAEWDQDYQNRISRLQAIQEALKQGAPTAKQAQVIGRQSLKHRELFDILSKGVSSLSVDDGLQLINQTFAALQIQ